MPTPPPSFEWPPATHRRRMVVALCCCAIAPACAHSPSGMTPSTPPSSITEITLERDCNGCAQGSLLNLHRDGRVVLTLTGKARLGTQDQVSRGHIRREDFEALAQQALAAGFFGLDDRYEDPTLQDGAWVQLRIARGSELKQVLRRDEAGPAALKALEAAIAAQPARAKLVPDRR